MRPAYPQSATNQRDRWMVSYVDVLTILLIFFLVAAAKGLKIPPAQPAIPACPSATRAEGEQPRTDLIRAQERLREILFSSGEDAVSSQAEPTIKQIADVLRDIPNNVRLIGHADTVPIHNRRFSSNWDLSMARSQKILELLSGRYGIPESRLSITSYGPYRPAASNDTEDGRASNRRVEIVILDESRLESPQGE
jgi:outer membrane protein OmpA-like peptidoglycan-associated protein